MQHEVITVTRQGRGYPSLAAAVAAAPDDAVILVGPGEYAGQLVLTKPVEIIPADGPGSVRLTCAAGPPVVLAAEYAALSGLVIESADERSPALVVTLGTLRLTECELTSASWATAVACERGDLRLRNCRVRNSVGDGVVVTSAASCLLESGELLEIAGTAVLATGQAQLAMVDTRITGAGVSIEERAAAALSRVMITGAGVRLSSASEAELADCVVADSAADGVLVAGSARLHRCRVTRAGGHGLAVAARSAVQAHELIVSRATGDGVHVGAEAEVSLTDCRVTEGQAHGCAFEAGATGVITGSVFTGNAGDGIRAHDAVRITGCTTHGNGGTGLRLPEPVAQPVRPDALRQLLGLVGLTEVKREIVGLVNLARMARRRVAAGLTAPPLARHLVFAGAPGTGRMTVARLYGAILAEAGVLDTSDLVEVTPADLLGPTTADTAGRTASVVAGAAGGILYLHDAHTLGAAGDRGRTVAATLARSLAEHGERLVLIATGPAVALREFLAGVPTLAARFSRAIDFPDYTPEELVTIFQSHCQAHDYRVDEAATVALLDYFGTFGHGNGRAARRVFERMTDRHASRLATGPGDLTLLTLEDFTGAGVSGDGVESF